MSAIRGTDFSSLCSGQVDAGDHVLCRGGLNEVYSVADDAYFPEGFRDSIRFTKDFVKNVNKQPFDIIKSPMLQGKIMNIDKKFIGTFQDISIILDNITLDDIGCLKVTYRNMCFNHGGEDHFELSKHTQEYILHRDDQRLFLLGTRV